MKRTVRKTNECKKPYELADPLPEGEVMKDLTGNLWRLGTPFATGGFGLIYEAFSETNPCSNGTSYVIKLQLKITEKFTTAATAHWD
ncbi:hypothetical protein LSAT2_028287 [Lamellibrachia satsuma]|nr:hypothetical protein LSAT2_028287 [Lamellibrachia satsuma]